ncbi:hypothetical protein BDV96DRAFT_483786 [Lophiotrema nucula]|uniref:Alpha-1,3-mannosyltransferase n=1 Tax=Lophiotrema nucula TaxID=690887 RepID=A0A6A5ZPD7_9PLEO|nr:hypothetical protein BDV96DRAFT_483786 [Lophiotrema nucula]
MPPHLHPRSRMTTSLFTTTLAVSFLVVATPHFLPCPVDNRAFADSADPEALQRRRRRRIAREETCNDVMSEERGKRKEAEEIEAEARRKGRECPVPKPGGLIGQVLGFKKEEERDEVQVVVKSEVERARRRNQEKDQDPS